MWQPQHTAGRKRAGTEGLGIRHKGTRNPGQHQLFSLQLEPSSAQGARCCCRAPCTQYPGAGLLPEQSIHMRDGQTLVSEPGHDALDAL